MSDLKHPTLSGIQRASRDLAHYLPPTPLVRSEILSNALDADVWLKYEFTSPVASFKLRGALTALLRAETNNEIPRAVTCSTGNHGQAVAYAARMTGLQADIFLPSPPNPVKKAMIEAFGATVHESGTYLEDAREAALTFCRSEGGLFVDDGESVDVMEGAGTVGLEIGQELETVDWVIVPTGGGNLVSGTATAMKELHPEARVVAVQSESASAIVESFHQGRAISKPAETFADGLAQGEPPALALEVMREKVDEGWTVSEDGIRAAIHTLAESAHVLVEPAGAAGLAAAWENREKLRGSLVVLVLTGANISAQDLREALGVPPLFSLA